MSRLSEPGDETSLTDRGTRLVRDLHDLLRDATTGEKAAALVEQGVANLWDETALERGLGRLQTAGSPEPADGFAFTAPVGSFASNRFGLHDMDGNVAEWSDNGTDVVIVHGGSFRGTVEDARSARHRTVDRTGRYDNVGFRAARRVR